MSDRNETWRELAEDIRKRAECPLRHGEERITSGEAIGNLLLDIARRVEAVGERSEERFRLCMGGGFDHDFHAVLKRLETVNWRKTMFEDLQTYYAEEGTYVLRCKVGDENEHLCIIKARSLDSAISHAVFDLHKSDERKMLTTQKADDAERVEVNGDGAVNSTKTQNPQGLSFGNAAKLREALEWATSTIDVSPEVLDETEDWENEVVCWVQELQEKAHAALSAPPRNCDVGTADEQMRMFKMSCDAHPTCAGCPCGSHPAPSCGIAWAQLPYEAALETGGDK